MQIKKLCSVYIILIFLLSSSVISISSSSKNDSIPAWDSNWSYSQEIPIPISTDKPSIKLQPIDIKIKFEHSCWAANENEHSIRIVCWDGRSWHDLESQIYDLEHGETNHITECGLVFLIPEFADGNEKYFIYYDDNKKSSIEYMDHVSVKDNYYYSEPITGVLAEGDYYEIAEDGYCVYAIGQKGQVMNRKLSQNIIKMKPKSKVFDHVNIEIIAALCFSYFEGVNDEDEISSDQSLVSKEIINDGNLMIEVGIISESSNKNLLTTCIYKYYYCPNGDKRISMHVKHEILNKGVVSGIINLDGRYGTISALKSRSERVNKMRFGEMLPYLHVYGEDNYIKEYYLNTDPESKNREWIIPYSDDCDLGKDAWISYDEGENGKAHAFLFSSNKDIVKSGSKENDGIHNN